MIPRFSILLFATFLIGCSENPAPTESGTPGMLRIGAATTSDILVHIYQKTSAGFEEIGFGQTAEDGSFGLFQPDASGPLWLQTGDYAITLESIGAPIRIPGECRQPQTTPLKLHWTEADHLPLIEVPEATPSRTKR
ncbi:MAG: hypothetical protein RLZZ232_420 [Planctomycetota bacterium]|jgi:hypothetical protein